MAEASEAHVSSTSAGLPSPSAAAGHGESSCQDPHDGHPINTGSGEGKSAISLLQEYVQRARLLHLPPNCPILQWHCEKRMLGGASLEFRATVAFLLDGMPHHSVGVWNPSKKVAQHDAARRALNFFSGRWRDLAKAIEREGGVVQGLGPAARAKLQQWQEDGRVSPASETSSMTCSTPDFGSNVEVLEDFCRRLGRHHSMRPPTFHHEWDSEGCCRSFVQLELLAVAHTFSGSPCASKDAADEDLARRVLWYLRHPMLEHTFVADDNSVKALAQTIPEPCTSWDRGGCDDSKGQEAELAERKTTIMRVQNRLQRVFAGQLQQGTSVWSWAFERAPKENVPKSKKKDKNSALIRAAAHVPLANWTFVGNWALGQREAQIDACAQIAEFLDTHFPHESRIIF